MEAGLYKVETINEGVALLSPAETTGKQFTWKVSDFQHDVTTGDVVEFYREGETWHTKYIEEKTSSLKSHTKDFVDRILEQE